MTATITTALSMSLDGFIAGPQDGPALLGSGVRLLDNFAGPVELERIEAVEAPGVTHLRYRVVR